MTLSIQDLTDRLVAYAKTTDNPVNTIQNLTYQAALKELSQSDFRFIKPVYQKSQRLAYLQLIQEKLQAIVDTESWREIVTTVFPKATFKVNTRKRQILIEV